MVNHMIRDYLGHRRHHRCYYFNQLDLVESLLTGNQYIVLYLLFFLHKSDEYVKFLM